MTIQTMTLGYARLGKRREVKKAVKAVWSGTSDTDSVLQTVHKIAAYGWKNQWDAGCDRIAVGNQTFYDHGLDWTGGHSCFEKHGGDNSEMPGGQS